MITKASKASSDVSTVLDNAASQFRGLNTKEPGQWPLLPKVAPGWPPRWRWWWRLVRRAVRRRRRTGGRARARARAEAGLHQQARPGGQPRRTAQAEAAGAGVRHAAREAAARQGRDGRAAVRHQPGGPGPRPAVRAVPPGPGRGQGLLRRAADRDPRQRPLPRHRCLRRRRGQPVAHRHAAQPGDHAGGADSSGLLSMEATARTYRYLDAAEVAAQQKAAAAKAKAAGAKK
jgi:type IV pilus assembly protein PilO